MRTASIARLLLPLLLLVLPAAVQAQFTFTTNNGAITITGYTGSGGAVAIPSSTNGYPVTGIGEATFYFSTSLTSVTIPNTVTNIGDEAFDYCTGLTSVTIPNSVTSIGTNVFENCTSLTNATIGNSVTSIGDWAFKDCTSLTSVTIGSTVTSIGNKAFDYCTSLTSVTIPNSVTSIGDLAFNYCTSLTNVTIGNHVTSIGDEAFFDCTSLISITIPNSVTSIGGAAFGSCNSLISITIPNSVTSIGDAAFSYCVSLISVTIPYSVTSIGQQAFEGCTNLTTITVSAGNPAYSSVSGVLFDKSQRTLIAYPGGKSGNYTIPSSVASIEVGAFGGCWRLTGVTIPNSVTSIGDQGFYDCTSLTAVTIPNSVTNIGSNAFSDCSSLASVTIGTSVTSIGVQGFSDCTSLTAVTIPNSVTRIGDGAFFDCTSLTAITVETSNPVYSSVSGVLFDKSQTALIQYPAGNAAQSYTIPSSVTSIGNEAFFDCTSLTSVTIPNTVTNIGQDAFYSCTSLTSVTIPNSVTSIAEFAFQACTSLTSVTIGSGVTSIGNDAFDSCTSLAAITVSALNPVFSSVAGVLFNKSQTTLIEYPSGNAAESYTVPNSVTNIADFAFFYCGSLTNVTIAGSVTSIGVYAFCYCFRLTSMTVGSSVTSIGDYAFSACSSLTSVTIPASVTSIGDRAFEHCTSLTSAYFQGNAPSSVGELIFLDDPVTVYFYAGTTGWGTTFGGAKCVVIDTPPIITIQPRNALVNAYDSTSFSVTATGTQPLFYQWSLNDSNILNATNSSLIITNITESNLGTYTVVVTNIHGATNASANLTMYPFLATSFVGLDTYWGLTNTLSVVAWGTELSYQWSDNGVVIQDATNQTLTLTSIQFTNAGLYSVVVSNKWGSVTNTPEEVVVHPAGVSLRIHPDMHPGVTLGGKVGYAYIIQSNADLTKTNGWTTVATMTLTNPVQVWEDLSVNAALPTNAQRFYRVLPGQ